MSPETSPLTRRTVLKGACTAALALSGLGLLGRRLQAGEPLTGAIGFGPLVADPKKIFDLPAGFTYDIVSRTGETMDDGLMVADACDGMGAFAGPDGTVVLIRNHELTNDPRQAGPFGPGNAKRALLRDELIYDAGPLPCLGGTSTVVWDPKRRTRVRQFQSLAGTNRNCAGGVTPWNSWLTCEETVARAGAEQLTKDHGYVFDVPASATGAVAPVPLPALGRFRHEAAAIDPRTGIVYLTEDMGDGLFYRCIPVTPGKLIDGGKLQALAVVGLDDSRGWNAPLPGGRFACRWIDVAGIDNPNDDLRLRGRSAGATIFARGEGMWWDGDQLHFTCTTGGARREGQIFTYRPGATADAGGELELLVDCDGVQLENCDNLTVAPWGDLVVCEDEVAPQAVPGQRLLGVTPEGRCYDVGRNARDQTELAGACFSPDGSILFVNLFAPGMTLAITGPFPTRAR